MKKFLHTRVLPILLCFTLSFGIISYETPKAEAVISETAVLTGVVCAYLSSVGISLAMDFASSGAMEKTVSGLVKAYCGTDEAFQTLCNLAVSTGISLSTGRIYITKPLAEKLDGFVSYLTGHMGVGLFDEPIQIASLSHGFYVTECSNTASNMSSYTYGGFRTMYDFAEYNVDSTASLIYSLGVNSKVAVLAMSEEYFAGYYFNSDGVFCAALFNNPYGAVHSTYFGVYDVADLFLVSAWNVDFCNGNWVKPGLYFYNMSYARSYAGFSGMDCYAFDWAEMWWLNDVDDHLEIEFFAKESVNEDFSSSTVVHYLWTHSGNVYQYGEIDPAVCGLYYPSVFSFDESAITATVPDAINPVDIDTLSVPDTYYVADINISDVGSKDEFYEKILAHSYSNTLTATGEVAVVDASEIDSTQTDTDTDEDAKPYLPYIPQIYEQVKGLPASIAEKIGALIDSVPSAIAEEISELFTPDKALIAEITDTFQGKFGFISTLKRLGDDLLSMTPETEPPVIWIHLEDAESEYGYSYGGMVKALDLSWYQKYKADVDRIISGFLWIGFLWLIFKRAASIIQGGEMLTEYSNDLTRGHRESNEAKYQNWLWRD